MKIGIVCYPSLGGSGVVATELGHALAKRGHEVHFITYEPPFRLNINEENIFFHEVDIFQYDLFRYPDYALNLAVKIAQVVDAHHLDILHVHYAIPHATSAFLAKQLLGSQSPAIMTTLHGTDITLVGRDPSYYKIVKFSIEQSDAVSVVSEGLRLETRDSFGISKKINVIYNFFDPQPSLDAQKPMRERFVASGEKLIIHVSNFRSVKRVEDVVKIFQRINLNIPSKLLLVGTGEGLEPIRLQVNALGLEERVIFVGKIREVDPYIASADLFLLPSAHESFGLVALEALSYGVPVIASNVCGLPEVVTHGETGYLAPTGDVDAMSHFALNLLTDSNLYEKMSAKAKQDARERFSLEKILPQYLAIYQEIAPKTAVS
ncbi:MAG: N-acetyl-alpha-D-glucosaminyl L-malate synthase BshA [Chlamydiales bacterium]